MSETISRSEAPETIYAVYSDDGEVPEVTTADEQAAYDASEMGYRVVTYTKA